MTSDKWRQVSILEVQAKKIEELVGEEYILVNYGVDNLAAAVRLAIARLIKKWGDEVKDSKKSSLDKIAEKQI